jgi:hypothetical protein
VRKQTQLDLGIVCVSQRGFSQALDFEIVRQTRSVGNEGCEYLPTQLAAHGDILQVGSDDDRAGGCHGLIERGMEVTSLVTSA